MAPTGLVTGERVNLRSGPGLTFEALYQFPQGQEIPLLERSGEWYGTSLPIEVPVYVHSDYVAAQEVWGLIQGDRVHVRCGAGLNFTSLGFLSKGDKVQLRGAEGQWRAIVPPNFCRGWIHAGFVVGVPEFDVPELEDSHGNL